MRIWGRWVGFVIFLLVLASCKSSTPNLKPAKEPEAYNVPPLNDKRYNGYIQYPEDLLNQDPYKKAKKDAESGANPANMRGIGGMMHP
jgi:hypothetical protein